MGCVYAYVLLLTFLGPENLGRSFSVTHDSDMAEATGKDVEAVLRERIHGGARERYSSDDGGEKGVEAGTVGKEFA